MSKMAVIYWSGTGNTEMMAEAVAEGAKSVDPDADIFRVSDLSADDAAEYDTLVLGCPAMGTETLEEYEFEPFFTELENKLGGKNVALFGSYGWGDGEWMRHWAKRVQDAGANLIGEGLTVMEAPDEAGRAACAALGKEAAAQSEGPT